MDHDLSGARVTHSTPEEIVVKTDDGEQYKIYLLGDAEPTRFSGTLPPENSTITNIGSDYLSYKTLSGETDSLAVVGGEESVYLEVERL